ncbi:MAG TPA: RDD family protein [Candidatus Acidoferrales bacterium]|nr:RDD family protein [Candidatus Acidoferrales bacterium]
MTVLIEPGAGVWAPAPDAAAASEENAPVTTSSEPTYVPPAAPVAAVRAPQPVFAAAYAGFWRRFAAYWIDWFIFFSIELLIAFARGIPIGTRQNIEPQEFAKGLVVSLVIGWLYGAVLESSPWQATIGKRAMDICVTDLQGRRIGFAKASGRFFGKIISAMILGIGFIMIAFTERKQGLHDQLAGCLVIRRTE